MKLYNVEVEKAILGSLLIDNSLIETVNIKIKPEYFYITDNQKIYESIIKFYNLHKIVDITSLNDFDIEYVSKLYDSVTTTSSLNHHVKILIDLAVRRNLIKASDNIKNIASNEDITEIETVKSESLAVINNISIPENKRPKRTMMNIVSDTLTKLENAFMKGENAYYKWDINWLQMQTGGMQEGYTILAARPSVGKTALALQLSKCIAKQGAKVAIFSLETMENKIVSRLIINHGNIDGKYFKKPELLNEEIWRKIAITASQIAELPIYLYDDIFYLEEIILKVQELKAKSELDAVVIDYLQLVETKKKFSSSNERITYISRQIKILQQTLGLQIMVLSQFSRETEKLKRAPILSDLRDSGAIEQDATDIWFLHVDPDFIYEINKPIDTALIIAKQKEGQRNIKKTLKFYGNSQRFYEN
jgi:replicative DNA helicase